MRKLLGTLLLIAFFIVGLTGCSVTILNHTVVIKPFIIDFVTNFLLKID